MPRIAPRALGPHRARRSSLWPRRRAIVMAPDAGILFNLCRRAPLSICLLEVGDLILASQPDYRDELRSSLQERFHFGKWKAGESDLA
eukprot:1940730-Pyramimonas_sp.AAC.1